MRLSFQLLFHEFVESNSSFIVFLHHNADMDAFASAIGFKSYVETLGKEVSIFADRLNENVQNALKRLPHVIIHEEETLLKGILEQSEHVGVLLLDVGDHSQLGFLEPYLQSISHECLIVDHHNESWKEENRNRNITHILDPESTSTSEIISELLISSEFKIPLEVATLLLAGIISDSQRFLRASAKTFTIVQELIMAGGDYQEAILLCQKEMSYSEKIARLRAIQRAKVETVDNIVLATSFVSSFESSAARALLGAGADIAFVVAIKENELRGSARVRNGLVDKFDMQKILEKLGIEFHGRGGGHSGAAGINIPHEGSKQEKRELMWVLIERFRDLIKEETINASQ